ncbi:methyl-accepting chemotaxis protein [Rhizobium sp. PP-F2F-G48]|uniref:HAMP domain-containing methyl-accepting chemotaxis protein n=1 Tax=Rhizobium sp. PP-F2F-G48 TaxID=2135651 RepID=UPI001046FA93|nr:HAMP domain-containing methyl-accepting chemotaxis protein [Rhizobium sp. PP-F2F-G48]TCM50791.1 methyl-accepting chemotaxis protein [Rhizobium sp. PP-F2F-G48]
MKRPKLSTALIGTVIGLFAMTAILAGTSIHSMTSIDGNNDAIVDDWMPSVSRSKDIDIALGDLRIAYRDHVLATSDDEQSAAEQKIASSLDSVQKAIESYALLVKEPSEIADLAALKGSLETYITSGTQLVALSRANKDEDAKLLIASPAMKGAALGIDTVIDKVVATNETGAAADGVENQHLIEDSINLAYILAALGVIFGVCAIAFVIAGIAKPIARITGAMRRLADGDTKSEVPFADRTDEIGAMAGAVDIFRQAAIANKQLEADAEENRLQAERDRVRLTAEAEAAAQLRLNAATAGLAAGLKQLAAGDLSFTLSEPFAPDFEALRHDLNGAVAQLAETLQAVAQATGSIDSGSQEISRGADDLSKRTEQQAASLEETAAALDQITANVSNSSKRADEARSVAVQANASASESGKVVSKAVEAMGKIEASSNEVSNIIGVIDEIAFQTNLLALNAGVEAARAGEAGKGFAVVAQEVRELAQRSAKAAKEIKELIRNSSIEVQNGVKLVSETGTALRTIEGYIVTVNQHMDAIATSAREQSVGLGEVNTAVNQMDQVTQQNAAMVEETSAAGATLANESGKLRQLIGQFTLGGAPSNAAILRQTAAAMGGSPVHRTATSPVRKAAPRPAPRTAAAFVGNAAVNDSWEEF